MAFDADRSDAKDRFRGVFDEYRPQLYRYVASRLQDPADIDDVCQEAYLRLLRIEKPELVSRPQDYLFRIATNVINDFYLKRRREPRGVSLDAPRTGDVLASPDAGLEDAVASRMELQRLQTTLEGLPPLYSAALLLRKRDGLSHREIAERLQISLHTVRKYLTRAVAQCRLKLKEPSS